MRTENLFKGSSMGFTRILLIPLLLTMSCTKRDDITVPAPTPFSLSSAYVTYDWVDLKTDKDLSGDKLSVREKAFKDIQDSKPVEFNLLTQLMIQDQQDLYNSKSKPVLDQLLEVKFPEFPVTLNEVESFLSKASQNVPHSFQEIKPAYEANIKKLNNYQDPRYQLDARNIVHIWRKGLLQCYSGTLLNQIIARRVLGAIDFRTSNIVVIFEKGHILSGYVTRDSEGRNILYGVENTAIGKALFKYGRTDQLHKLARALRVVDAEYFFFVALFKNDISNGSEVVSKILEKTAEKYGIELDKIEKRVAAFLAPVDPTIGIIRPEFAFGSPDVGPEIQDRSVINTTQTIWLKENANNLEQWQTMGEMPDVDEHEDMPADVVPLPLGLATPESLPVLLPSVPAIPESLPALPLETPELEKISEFYTVVPALVVERAEPTEPDQGPNDLHGILSIKPLKNLEAIANYPYLVVDRFGRYVGSGEKNPITGAIQVSLDWLPYVHYLTEKDELQRGLLRWKSIRKNNHGQAIPFIFVIAYNNNDLPAQGDLVYATTHWEDPKAQSKETLKLFPFGKAGVLESAIISGPTSIFSQHHRNRNVERLLNLQELNNESMLYLVLPKHKDKSKEFIGG